MLANQTGLSGKYVSERHHYASQEKLTAGQAAKIFSKKVSEKISAKEIVAIFKTMNGVEPEWHHSGFYRSAAKGSTMGRTFFFEEDDINSMAENWVVIKEKQAAAAVALKIKSETIVKGFCYLWNYDYGGNYGKKRNFKVLSTFEGSLLNKPSNFTACTDEIFELAKAKEGKKYFGWDEPKISDFI